MSADHYRWSKKKNCYALLAFCVGAAIWIMFIIAMMAGMI